MADSKAIVIVGGGIIGASIAYHLAKRGAYHVLVLERSPFLGAGMTSYSAGGVRAQFASEVNIRLSIKSIRFYEQFESLMGETPEFHQVGYLFVTSRPEQLAAFEANVQRQRQLGVPAQLVTPAEIVELVPQIRADDLVGGTFCPIDGYADPHAICQAFIARAKELGVQFRTESPATGFVRDGGRILAVETPSGPVSCQAVVNAAGCFSRELALLAGLDIPVAPTRRQIITTGPFDGLPERMPMTIDMQTGLYLRREGAGILMGMANWEEKPGFDTSIDRDFQDRIVMAALERVPVLERAQLGRGWAGLYDITPDHHAILGLPDGYDNFYLACGFSGHGIMHAPAVGEELARLIVDKQTEIDLSSLSLARFSSGNLHHESQVI